MSKVCLIGNSGINKHLLDGQTTKVRLYLSVLKQEHCDVLFIDLENFIHHALTILNQIRKAVHCCDRIVLISAERGCKILIPYINFLNRRFKKIFILPLVGTSVLHYSIDRLSDNDKRRFFDGEYNICKFDKRTSKQLSQISCILPETKIISCAFKVFYHLNNVFTLTNFRDYYPQTKKGTKPSSPLSILFLSRVMREKGLFDLLSVVDDFNSQNIPIRLDVYGTNCLNKADDIIFENYIKKGTCRYLGSVENKDVISTISYYDLFVFPTRFIGEGTPGVIIESLLGGVPVLTSDFPQAPLLLKNGYDSLFFKMGNSDDLKEKMMYILKNHNKLNQMKKNAQKSGLQFTYCYNRKIFLKYICGLNEKIQNE